MRGGEWHKKLPIRWPFIATLALAGCGALLWQVSSLRSAVIDTHTLIEEVDDMEVLEDSWISGGITRTVRTTRMMSGDEFTEDESDFVSRHNARVAARLAELPQD